MIVMLVVNLNVFQNIKFVTQFQIVQQKKMKLVVIVINMVQIIVKMMVPVTLIIWPNVQLACKSMVLFLKFGLSISGCTFICATLIIAKRLVPAVSLYKYRFQFLGFDILDAKKDTLELPAILQINRNQQNKLFLLFRVLWAVYSFYF